jgi:hypothetical protein
MSLMFPNGSRTVTLGGFGGQKSQAQPQKPSWQKQDGSFDYTGWLRGPERAAGDPQAQQAWQQAGSPKSFRPGQAQPIQPQSQGSPYGQQGYTPSTPGTGGNQSWPGVSQNPWQNNPSNPPPPGTQWQRVNEGSRSAGWMPVSTQGAQGGQQPPFTQTMQTPFGQMNPNQYYQQRDAFIQTANDQMGQYMANGGVYQGQGAPPPTWGQQPQFNPMQMWGQAGDMVQQGWQNPYAQQPYGQQYGGGGHLGHFGNANEWQPPAAPQQQPSPMATYLQSMGGALNSGMPTPAEGPNLIRDLIGDFNRAAMQPEKRGGSGRGYEAAYQQVLKAAQDSGAFPQEEMDKLTAEYDYRKKQDEATKRLTAAGMDPSAYHYLMKQEREGRAAFKPLRPEEKLLTGADVTSLPMFGDLQRGDRVTKRDTPSGPEYTIYDWRGVDKATVGEDGAYRIRRKAGPSKKEPEYQGALSAAEASDPNATADAVWRSGLAQQQQDLMRKASMAAVANGSFNNVTGQWTQKDALARVSAANQAASGQPTDQADQLQKSRAAHMAAINSQANKKWLASLSPANRRIYSMMQQI